MERAVKRGIERREVQNIQKVGIDEKSFGRAQNYISVLTDLDHARVIEVVPSRDKGAGCSLFETLPAQQLEKLRAVAMDMSESFAAAAREMAPQADMSMTAFMFRRLSTRPLIKCVEQRTKPCWPKAMSA